MDAFCTVVTDEKIRYANVLNLSERGILIERPSFISDQEFGLELELPQIDKLLWFKARHSHYPGVPQSRKKLRRGVHIVGGASQHLNLIKEFVFDQRNMLNEDVTLSSRLLFCSRYVLG